MPAVSFTRAVNYYDSTRGIADKIEQSILSYTLAQSTFRFLDIGIGTGLVAAPFIQAGYDYVGVDISAEMMVQVERKTGVLSATMRQSEPNYKLTQADVAQYLPFSDSILILSLLRECCMC